MNSTIRSIRNGVAVVAATAAATYAFALTGATEAKAVSTATTVVTWGGTGCIQTQGAMIANPYRLSIPTWQCAVSGVLSWTEAAPSGAWIGVDPIMGDADWIGCTIDDGWNTYSDFAVAGDGTDVTCLRTAN